MKYKKFIWTQNSNKFFLKFIRIKLFIGSDDILDWLPYLEKTHLSNVVQQWTLGKKQTGV
jgi:hypothetical protein